MNEDGSEGIMEGRVLRGSRGQLKWLTWGSWTFLTTLFTFD